MFSKMKTFGCLPNVVTYTILIHAYGMLGMTVLHLQPDSVPLYLSNNKLSISEVVPKAGMWEKAYSLFEEMETSNIGVDNIVYSTLMAVLNKGGQHERVLCFAERMREKGVTFGEATYFEIVAACSK